MKLRSITTKFIIMGIIGFILLVMSTYSGYKFVLDMKGGGTRINMAGQLRFRSFEMAWLNHKIIEAMDPQSRESLVNELKQKIDTFEDIVKSLRNGNRKLGIGPLKHEEGLIRLDRLFDEWNKTLKPMLLEMAELPEGRARLILNKYDSRISGYVYEIDKLVSLLSDEHEKMVKDFEYIGSLILVFSLLIGIVVYIYVRYNFIKPIFKFKSVTEVLERGDLDARINIKNKDEIGDLAQTFNQMAGALKEAFEDNRLLIERLEGMVKERTRELEIARLRAEAANMAKSDFLANMSHELRTPLNSILGFSEVIQDKLFGDLNDKQQEYVNYIHSSGNHLLSLINDILDLSTVESGKIELELSRFHLSEALNVSMIMLKERAMKHRIKMGLEIAPDADMEIEADNRKLKQILFNLLNNAVKFTPDGGSVAVKARRTTDEGQDAIEISVEDTGIGIKPEDMDKLFQPFSQIESPYEKKYEGTGLGLALTKKLIELHGGRIWAESEYGKGSKFTFVMPIRQPSQQEGGR